MLTRDELKNRLLVLIDKYKSLDAIEKKEMTEDDTRRRFIDKLLTSVLEWDDDLWSSQKSV